jgi:hypothetical protein
MRAMRGMRAFAVLCVLGLPGASALHAQAPRRVDRFPAVQQEVRVAPTANMIAGGLVGGAVGLVVFGYMGALIADNQADDGEDLAALGGFVVGATIGEALMVPLGVHLVNHRRGNYGRAALVSAAIAAGGLALAFATEDQAPLPGIILVAIPIAQIATSVAIERSSSR